MSTLMLMLMLLADIGGGGGSPVVPVVSAPGAPVGLAIDNSGGVPCLAAPLTRRAACPRLSHFFHSKGRKCKN